MLKNPPRSINIKHEIKEDPQEIKKKKSCDITGSGENNSECNNENQSIDQAEQIAENILQQHKAIVFTQEGCEGCAEFKEDFKQQISDGKIKEIDIYSKSGEILDNKFDIENTPTLLAKKEDKIVKCFHMNDNSVECSNGSKIDFE
jgi:hypothetical protein